MKAIKPISFVLAVTFLGACSNGGSGKKANLKDRSVRAQSLNCGTSMGTSDIKAFCTSLLELQKIQEDAKCQVEWSKQIAQYKCEEVIDVPQDVKEQAAKNPVVAEQTDTQPDTSVEFVETENTDPVGDGKFHVRTIPVGSSNPSTPVTTTPVKTTVVPPTTSGRVVPAPPAPVQQIPVDQGRVVPAPTPVQTPVPAPPVPVRVVIPEKVAPPQSSGTVTVTAGELLGNTEQYIRGGVTTDSAASRQGQTELTRVQRIQGEDGSVSIEVAPYTQLLEVQEGRVASNYGNACEATEKINAEARNVDWGLNISSSIYKDNLTGWSGAVCAKGLDRAKNKKLWDTMHSFLKGKSWFKQSTALESCTRELANYAIACSQAVRDGHRSTVFQQ